MNFRICVIDIIFDVLKICVKVIIYVTSGLSSWIIRFV